MWEAAKEYSAMIGGILYKNVANPIKVNKTSIIVFSREKVSSVLGVSLKVYDKDSNLIVRVINNEIHDLKKGFTRYVGVNRVSIVNSKTGQVVLDLIYDIDNQEHELEVSFFTVFQGYPLVFHPERTKCGKINDNGCPDIARLTLRAENTKNHRSAIEINNSQQYLSALCFENLSHGIVVKVGKQDDPH